MTAKKMLMGLVFLFGGLGACDQSKPELDKTKADLTAMTAERDSLKTQVDQANAKVTALTAQVADLQAKAAAAAAAAAAPPPPAEEEKPAKGKHAAKKPAAAANNTGPAPSAAKMQEMQKAPEARSGRGHF
jgi:hypothetical protein